MPHQLTSLTVFVSGPSDVQAEKSALETVIRDLSALLEKTHNITLRLVCWPDTIRPGIGTDPQSVINEQIGCDYDIYIGVLSTRFGQPTPRAESGTEEEFKKALGRFQIDSTSLRVLFYFKNTEQNPFTIDLAQLEKVRKFREEIGESGVLYKDFKDTAEFVELLRNHIPHLVVDEFQNSKWKPIVLNRSISQKDGGTIPLTPLAQLPSADQEEDEDAFGLFELLEDTQKATSAINEIMLRMGENIKNIGTQFEQRTLEANDLTERQQRLADIGGSRQQQVNLARAKEVVNQAAEDLDKYATSLVVDLKQYKLENRTMLENMRRAFILQKEFDGPPETIERNITELKNLMDVLGTCRDNVTGFQATVSRMPALTGNLRRARRRASTMLGELIAELQFTLQESGGLLKMIYGDDSIFN